LEDNKRLITVDGNQVALTITPINSFEIVNFIYTDFSKMNYKHNQELLKGIDLTQFYLSLNAIKHNLGDSPVLYFPSTAAILMETEKNKIISIFKSQIHNMFKYIINIIITIIVGICFFVGIYCGCKHSQHLKRSLKRFYNNHSSILSSKIKS
jgi:hypothetical protein